MATEQIVRQSLHESLVAPLRDMIVRGELRAGDKVPEEQLCERFGVSRTPIREALKVLAAEGVLQIQPHRGAIVARITEDQINQLFPIMASLERLAGRLACAVATDDDVARVHALHDEMVARYAAGDEAAYLQLNRQIHDAIFVIADNPTLHSFYQQILTRIHSCRFVTPKTPEYWRTAVLEHEQMIAALEARDGETLGSLLERHITGTTVGIARDYVRTEGAEVHGPGERAARRGKTEPARDTQQAQI
jgi:DNA-binding GntR family transcriptional regulator